MLGWQGYVIVGGENFEKNKCQPVGTTIERIAYSSRNVNVKLIRSMIRSGIRINVTRLTGVHNQYVHGRGGMLSCIRKRDVAQTPAQQSLNVAGT